MVQLARLVRRVHPVLLAQQDLTALLARPVRKAPRVSMGRLVLQVRRVHLV